VFAVSVRCGSAYPIAASCWSLAPLLLACLLLGLGAAAAPPPAAAQPLVTSVTGLDDYDAAAFRQVRATGATFVQLAVPWYDIAPNGQSAAGQARATGDPLYEIASADPPAAWQPENPGDPHYDWSYLDKGVVNAISAGLTPVLQIDGAPQWAQRCKTPPQSPGGDLCDPDPAQLAIFAKAAAYRYSGRFGALPKVLYWQALNEPNLSLFFYPQFINGKPASPGLYRDLLNAFYTAVKSVDPANLVLGGGLGPIAVPGYTIGPMDFTRRLLCMKGRAKPRPLKGNCGGGVHFDIFDIHPYTTGSPTHEGGKDDVQMGDLAKLQKLLAAASKAGRIHGKFKKQPPLWINEFSWDSNPPDPGGLPMQIETRWVAEALYVAWKAGVSHFSWYSLRDQRHVPGASFKETLQSGLYFRGSDIGHDQPKEFMYAFRFPFVAYPTDKGLSVWGRTPDSAAGKVMIQLQRGSWRNAKILKANSRGIFTGLIPGRYGASKKGFARATYKGEAAMPFSMKPSRDFRQPPFG
jgi:hypothetical protein